MPETKPITQDMLGETNQPEQSEKNKKDIFSELENLLKNSDQQVVLEFFDKNQTKITDEIKNISDKISNAETIKEKLSLQNRLKRMNEIYQKLIEIKNRQQSVGTQETELKQTTKEFVDFARKQLALKNAFEKGDIKFIKNELDKEKITIKDLNEIIRLLNKYEHLLTDTQVTEITRLILKHTDLLPPETIEELRHKIELSKSGLLKETLSGLKNLDLPNKEDKTKKRKPNLEAIFKPEKYLQNLGIDIKNLIDFTLFNKLNQEQINALINYLQINNNLTTEEKLEILANISINNDLDSVTNSKIKEIHTKLLNELTQQTQTEKTETKAETNKDDNDGSDILELKDEYIIENETETPLEKIEKIEQQMKPLIEEMKAKFGITLNFDAQAKGSLLGKLKFKRMLKRVIDNKHPNQEFAKLYNKIFDLSIERDELINPIANTKLIKPLDSIRQNLDFKNTGKAVRFQTTKIIPDSERAANSTKLSEKTKNTQTSTYQTEQTKPTEQSETDIDKLEKYYQDLQKDLNTLKKEFNIKLDTEGRPVGFLSRKRLNTYRKQVENLQKNPQKFSRTQAEKINKFAQLDDKILETSLKIYDLEHPIANTYIKRPQINRYSYKSTNSPGKGSSGTFF